MRVPAWAQLGSQIFSVIFECTTNHNNTISYAVNRHVIHKTILDVILKIPKNQKEVYENAKG